MVKQHIFDKWKSNPQDIPPELLEWSKHVMDSYVKIRKQEEGSKLAVTKRHSLSPSEILAAIKQAEKPEEVVVEATFEDEEEEDADE
jgi:hypothetical protein